MITMKIGLENFKEGGLKVKLQYPRLGDDEWKVEGWLFPFLTKTPFKFPLPFYWKHS